MIIDMALTVTAGLIASFLAGLINNFTRKKEQKKGESIEDRVARLTKSLNEATSLISNIESEISARSSLATQLQNDIDKYNDLVGIKKPEVEAIAQLLRGELQKEGKSTFWKSFAVNFMFFILGAGISLFLSLKI